MGKISSNKMGKSVDAYYNRILATYYAIKNLKFHELVPNERTLNETMAVIRGETTIEKLQEHYSKNMFGIPPSQN